MRRKIPATYVYNLEKDTFTEYHDLIFDRISFTQQFDGVKDRVYAVGYGKKLRIEIAKHSEDIFHDRLKHEYVVYLNKPDRTRGAELIANYILNQNEIEISYHEKQLDKLRKRHSQFEAFKEKYVKTHTD